MKQDGQDGEKENEKAKDMKAKQSEDEISSTEEESSSSYKGKDKVEIKDDDNKKQEIKTEQSDYNLQKMNGNSENSYSPNQLANSPFPVPVTGTLPTPTHFQPQNYTCANTTSYHKPTTINPLGHSYYSGQSLPPLQPYNPSLYPNNDYLSPVFSTQSLSATSASHFDPYVPDFSANPSLSSSNLLTIEPNNE